MKIFVRLVCKNEEEMRRAEYMIDDILDNVQYCDIIDIGSYISADKFGGLKTTKKITYEGRSDAEE